MVIDANLGDYENRETERGLNEFELQSNALNSKRETEANED